MGRVEGVAGKEKEIELREWRRSLTGEMDEKQRYQGEERKGEGRRVRQGMGVAHVEGPY